MPQTLKAGMTGPDVTRWQTSIGEPTSGIMDANTVFMTKEFQKAHGLDADGVVGPATWAKIPGAASVNVKPDPNIFKSAAASPSPTQAGSFIKPVIAAPAQSSPFTSSLTTLEGHLPALPVFLGLALLALGAGMAIYKVRQ